MSRYAAGVTAGRRVLLGSGSLVFGASTSVAMIQESGNEDEAGPGAGRAGASSAAEPLLGAYVGAISAPRASLRVRADVSTDVVVSRLERPLTVDNSLPPLPWWSALLSVGVEWEVP
jgi:hypothetical protein